MANEGKRNIKAESAAYEVLLLLDSAHYIMQDIREEYFEKYDPVHKEDADMLCWEFSRNRARAMAVSELLTDAMKVLAQADIVR